MDEIIARHQKVAFQFSGGKDSLACLYLLRPYWDRLTVYYLNSGDAFPETLALVQKVRALVPNFVEIPGRVAEVTQDCGIPTDIVPYTATPTAMRMQMGKVPMIDRFLCCALSIMAPLHERMLADGVTLVIRGQKDADRYRSPLRSGYVDDVELLFPIEGWTDDQVFAFLAEQGVEIPRFYREGLQTTPDCMRCSAWWDDRRGDYLRRYHQEAYGEYRGRLELIEAELKRCVGPLFNELDA